MSPKTLNGYIGEFLVKNYPCFWITGSCKTCAKLKQLQILQVSEATKQSKEKIPNLKDAFKSANENNKKGWCSSDFSPNSSGTYYIRQQ